MFTKTMLAVSAVMVLGAASLATAGTERGGGYQVQAWQGTHEQTHSSFTTDVSRAYALDQSSNAKKKKAPKEERTQPAPKSGAAARAESDEQRRYEENH
jgi:hypothetical protein